MPLKKYTKKLLSFFIRFGLVGFCMLYVIWGMDWGQFTVALRTFGLWALLITLAYSFVPYLPLAVRFNFLTNNEAGFMTSLKASVFCLGINNMFPAKIGEVAKAFYLRRKTCIPLGRGLGLIFWERFADLNCLLAMGLFTAASMGSSVALVPLAIVVGGLWGCVFLIRYVPRSRDFFLKLVPGQKLKVLCADVFAQLQVKRTPGFYFGLSGYSALFWLGNVSVNFLVVFWVAQLDITYAQALTVFVVATLGFATPSSPGALGVVEAAFVLSLGWFGVDKPHALAVALLFRVATFIPPTLAALYVLAESGMSMKGIKKQSEEEL